MENSEAEGACNHPFLWQQAVAAAHTIYWNCIVQQLVPDFPRS